MFKVMQGGNYMSKINTLPYKLAHDNDKHWMIRKKDVLYETFSLRVTPQEVRLTKY